MIRVLSQGADDYMTKPFELGVLAVRVKVMLKRAFRQSIRQKCLTFGNLTIDSKRHEVRLDEEIVPLTALEFDLLYFLASHPDRIWGRAELIQEVWDYEYVGDPRVVDVHIGQIRMKIEEDPSHPI